MNANQLINMVTRIVVRRFVTFGIDAGVNALSKKDSAGRATPQDERALQQDGKQMSTRLRQSTRALRRLGRF